MNVGHVGLVAALVLGVGVVRAEMPRAVLADPLEWLYPDSRVETVRQLAETDVPANGVAEANVLVNGLRAGETVTLAGDAPEGEWLVYHDVPVEKNTGLDGNVESAAVTNVFVTRDAPFRVYDALEPLSGGKITATGGTMAFRYRLRKFPRVGAVDVTLSVAQGAFRATLPLRVNVHAAEVPPVGPASFKYTNWMNYESMATSHGLKPWSEPHWQMIERYVALAVYGRQSMVQVRVFHDGWRIDEEKTARFVAMLDKLGVAWLEGPHLCHFSGGNWHDKSFAPHGCTNLSTSAVGAAHLGKMAALLAALVEKRGWKDRWYQHVADEPADHNVKEYRMTCAVVRKHMPGFRLFDAVETPDMAGALDAYCPKNNVYETRQPEFDALRTRPSDELWCYTCCFPGGKWMNRLLDNEILRPVLIPWGCHLFRLDGYLHWGYNQFTRANDPLLVGVVPDAHIDLRLPPGDRNIVYAGPDGPWPSVRLEAMRQGFEDLELLRLLARHDPSAAAALVRRVMRGFGDYTTDPQVYRAARRDLLVAVSRAK